ncbi:hypothetical protein [Sphingomonas sp. ABOLH]|uniref:hypothetical protein n=1 Tax=Sphingomonas sp. ABOLH TaxID=1985881 RepID=UPI000F7E8AB7|nr:hypothetical protein [Sphingomonas sp. ABOLH]RSV16825.1 hypothetical protein CA237_19115 [Sphingomonas sp. ABOLH]
MSLIDLSIEERGFAPASIALAVRTIGACPAARHRPDARILCGIGVLTVTPEGGGYRFSSDARCLGEGDTPRDLLDWLEPYIASTGAVISWDNFGAVPRRLLALADPARHPQIIAAAADTAGRWRALPLGHTWHLRQAGAHLMPCVCPPQTPVDECEAAMPTVLLPDPATTAVELIGEAIAGWQCWARLFGDFDDSDHPAQAALRALARWRGEQPATR